MLAFKFAQVEVFAKIGCLTQPTLLVCWNRVGVEFGRPYPGPRGSVWLCASTVALPEHNVTVTACTDRLVLSAFATADRGSEWRGSVWLCDSTVAHPRRPGKCLALPERNVSACTDRRVL